MPDQQPFLLYPEHKKWLEGKGRKTFYRSDALTTLWSILFTAGLCLLASAFMIHYEITWLRLHFQGERIEAKVRKVEWRPATSDTSADYRVGYVYQGIQEGVCQTFESETSREDAPEVGSTLDAVMLKSDPSVCWLVEDLSWFPLIANMLALALVLPLGVILVVAGFVFPREYRAIRRLEQSGTVLPGVVLTATRTEDDEPPNLISVRFSFATPQGLVLESGATGAVKEATAKSLPQPGTPVAVLFLDLSNYKLL